MRSASGSGRGGRPPARAGRSIEAEAREILTLACKQDGSLEAPDLQRMVDELYPKKRTSVVRELISHRRRESIRE